MAIKLRGNTSNNTGKGAELTYLEMDTNLESFYYSSSLSGSSLELFTTGSTCHIVDLSSVIGSGGAGTQGVQGTNGTNGTNGSQGTQGANGTNGIGTQGAQGLSGEASAQGAQGIAGSQGTQGADGAQGLTGSGVQGVQGAAGSGDATTPGGINTQVQFNDNGAFGGDSGFTYDKTSNKVTITAPSNPSRTAPNLLLNSEVGNVTTNEVFGIIAANNTTDIYNPTNFPASIQFAADTNFSPGNYDTRVGIFVNSNATELEAIRLKSSGQNQLPQYGAGNFTGTPARTLAVDSSGNVIETAVLDTGSLENPSIGRDTTNSVTNVVFDVTIAPADANWTVEAVNTGGTPSGAGKARINNSTPASATQFSVWKTANSSVDISSPLEQLAPGSIITISVVGANSGTGTYRITAKSLITNAVTYNISYIEGAAFTYAVGGNLTIATVEAIFEYDLTPGYNYLNIRNNGSSSDRLRLRYEAATGEYPDGGGYIPVQILCNGSGQRYSLDYIADKKTYQWSLTGATGTWSATSPVIGFITNDFRPGDRFISSFLVWGEGLNEGIVPQHWTVYQSDTALEPSDRTVPTQWYQNTFNSTERVTTTTIPNLYELNGGTISIEPQGGTTDALVLGLGGLLTDYSTTINNVSGANLLQLNIVTPTAKSGWNIYWLGYRSSTNERYRLVNVSLNGGVGTNSPVKLDWSGRAEVSVDFSESKIIVWSSNWEN